MYKFWYKFAKATPVIEAVYYGFLVAGLSVLVAYLLYEWEVSMFWAIFWAAVVLILLGFFVFYMYKTSLDGVEKFLIEKINNTKNEKLIDYILQNEKSPYICIAVFAKRGDQAAIADIAKNNDDSKVRETACEKVTGGHNWDGCKCSRCGTTRDEQHDWDDCTCKRCGASGNHDWDGCKCKRCGETRDEQHDWYEDWWVTCEGASPCYRCIKCGGWCNDKSRDRVEMRQFF